MNISEQARISVSLSGFAKDFSGTRLSGERTIHIELPSKFDESQLDIMSKDIDLISELARKDPKTMAGILNAAQGLRFEDAGKLADSIGFNEANMIKRGGGQIGVAAAILAGLVILAIVVGSHDGGSQPEPVGPDVEGAPDAGANG